MLDWVAACARPPRDPLYSVVVLVVLAEAMLFRPHDVCPGSCRRLPLAGRATDEEKKQQRCLSARVVRSVACSPTRSHNALEKYRVPAEGVEPSVGEGWQLALVGWMSTTVQKGLGQQRVQQSAQANVHKRMGSETQ